MTVQTQEQREALAALLAAMVNEQLITPMAILDLGYVWGSYPLDASMSYEDELRYLTYYLVDAQPGEYVVSREALDACWLSVEGAQIKRMHAWKEAMARCEAAAEEAERNWVLTENAGNHGVIWVEMPGLPKCDFCKEDAEYDGRTTSGPWAYMCKQHFTEHGVGLGMGKGQHLV